MMNTRKRNRESVVHAFLWKKLGVRHQKETILLLFEEERAFLEIPAAVSLLPTS